MENIIIIDLEQGIHLMESIKFRFHDKCGKNCAIKLVKNKHTTNTQQMEWEFKCVLQECSIESIVA